MTCDLFTFASHAETLDFLDLKPVCYYDVLDWQGNVDPSVLTPRDSKSHAGFSDRRDTLDWNRRVARFGIWTNFTSRRKLDFRSTSF